MGALTMAATGPLERTAIELRRIERAAVWRRPRVSATRAKIRESDAFLELVEQCRERGFDRIPHFLWAPMTRALALVDPELRRLLGERREPGHVAACLFAAQERLLARMQDEKRERGQIVPLFPEMAAVS